MAGKNNFSFQMPGQQGLQNLPMTENGLPDFSRMTKAQIKAYDAAEGSYKRLLNGKPITRLWLANHYSAANAAAFKAQQAQKKAGGTPQQQFQQQPQFQPQQQFQQPPQQFQQQFQQQPQQFQQQLPPEQGQAQQGQFVRSAQGLSQPDPYAQFPSTVAAAPQGDEHFGKTVFIDHTQPTQEPLRRASLFCVSFGQNVEIKKIPFRIGRNPNRVDLCITDNEKLSGCHAEITYQNGNYYITDLNSLNHVFLNGAVIPNTVPTMLQTGSKIILGDEEFIFEFDD